MDIKEIQSQYTKLNQDLRTAVSTMERKNTIKIIRQQIKELQELCPHKLNEEYDFTSEKCCPYCGKHFRE